MIDPNDVVLTDEELKLCIDFSKKSAPTQQDIEFGQEDFEARSVGEVSRDTLIGKIAEVAFGKIMLENYGIHINLDFNIYPRGIYDDQDAKINDWCIDVKGTRQGGRFLLVEWNKLDFRQLENRLSHVYAMFSVGWNRNTDLPDGHASYKGAVTLRALADNVGYVGTLKLRKYDCIPGTTTPLQADNYGISFDKLNKNLDGLVQTMRRRKPDQSVVDNYRNPYTQETTREINASEEVKRLHIQRVKEIIEDWIAKHKKLK